MNDKKTLGICPRAKNKLLLLLLKRLWTPLTKLNKCHCLRLIQRENRRHHHHN